MTTAIAKSPTRDPVAVTRLGLIGDEQGDTVHHGGPDKAVLAYASEHYTAWSEQLGDLAYPAFGENLTTTGLLESTIVLGAVYQIGTTVLQVTQPRQPCYKLAAFHRRPDMAVRTQQTGRTGVYFRVLQPGTVCAGDAIALVSQPRHGITAAETHRVLNIDRLDRAAARRLLAHADVLPAHWRGRCVNASTAPPTIRPNVSTAPPRDRSVIVVSRRLGSTPFDSGRGWSHQRSFVGSADNRCTKSSVAAYTSRHVGYTRS